MGLVVGDSTVHKTTIFLRCVEAFLPEDKVLLLWYRNNAGGIYTPDLDGGHGVELKELLVAVEVAPAKGHAFGVACFTS